MRQDGLKNFLQHNGKPLTAHQLAAREAAKTRATQQRRPGEAVPAPVQPGRKKPKRNKACPCGSGVKFKKCCGAPKTRDPAKLPKQKPMDVATAAASTEAPADKNATALAMFNAGIDRRIVWAYIETGLYITEVNKAAHSQDNLDRWEATLKQYDEASPEERLVLLAPALPEDFDESSETDTVPDSTPAPKSTDPEAGE